MSLLVESWSFYSSRSNGWKRMQKVLYIREIILTGLSHLCSWMETIRLLNERDENLGYFFIYIYTLSGLAKILDYFSPLNKKIRTISGYKVVQWFIYFLKIALLEENIFIISIKRVLLFMHFFILILNAVWFGGLSLCLYIDFDDLWRKCCISILWFDAI